MERRGLLVGAILSAAFPVLAQGTPVTFPGPAVELAGRLYAPKGDGPFPAVVLLHGCSGMWRRDGRRPTAHYESWAEHWRSKGYMALLIDSFGPRGETEICTQKSRRVSPEQDRPRDAYAGLRWLAARKDVDRDHVHLMGWSNGSMTVLNAVREGAPGFEAKGPGFRSAVAFYPGCSVVARSEFRATIPVLIQSGGADDWTPARHCERLVAGSSGQGAPMEIDVYPDAHHGFDAPATSVRIRPEVRNPSSPTGWGATVGTHAEARAQAIARTTAWIQERNR